MTDNWKIHKLGELCEKVVTGGTPLTKIEEYYLDGDVPWLKTKEVNFCRIYETENFISELGLAKSSAKLIPTNSVIIAMYGQGDTAGRVAINKIPLATNQACCNLVLDKKKADYRFIYFYLKNSYAELVSRKTGSAQPNLNTKILKSFEVKIPPLPEQKAIASILSALDDKIELNLQMNKTLEEMAMALYKHWFVDFGPFQNGKFVPSELGEIPEGWEVKKLGEIAKKKSEKFNFSEKEEIVFINTGDVQKGRFLHSNRISKEGLPGQAKKAIAKGDILYSEIRPKNKRYAFVNFDSSDYVVSTKFMIINPKENILNKLLYRILTMQSTVNNFNSIAEGRSGTFPQITFDAISEIEFVLPPLKIQQEFQDIVSPMEEIQDELHLENQTLTKTRDTLLPKLISGAIRVKDIEKIIAPIL